MTNLNKDLEAFKSYTYNDKVKKVLNLIEIIKDGIEDLEYVYKKVSSEELEENIIIDMYQTLLELIIYQENLDTKNEQIKITQIRTKINNYLV